MTEKNMDLLLGQALELSFQEQINLSLKEEKSVFDNNLSLKDLERLVDLIRILPVDLQTILLEKHYYKNPPSNLEKVFNIENPIEKYAWTLDLLSQSLGLDDHLINDKDLDLACHKLMNTHKDKVYRIPKTSFDPSKAFRKKMQNLGLKIQGPRRQVLKKVAVIFLVLAGSISLFFSINTAARSKVYDWIIKDFGTHSTFSFVQLEEADEEILDLDDLKITYKTKNFKLIKTKEAKAYKKFIYGHEKNPKTTYEIRFKKLASPDDISAYKTGYGHIEEIYIGDHKGYYWHNNINYLLWQQNGIEILISGPINKDEMIKIAESVCK